MRFASLSILLDDLVRNERRKRLVVLALCCTLWLIYGAIFLPYLPLGSGLMGHDYAFYLPNLLAGYNWALQNSYWSIPWFTPAACGGMPFYADMNAAYISAPQILTLFVSPLRAVQITFMLFAFIGMWSAYGLMRMAFGASRTASVIAAALFLFNGFYAYRMLSGHLTYHAFALAPLLMAILLPRMLQVVPRTKQILPGMKQVLPGIGETLVRACLAALCLTYMFHSGLFHAIPPVLMACVIVILIHGWLFGFQAFSWALLAGAGLLALGLSAGKLHAAVSLSQVFPRDFYRLPGVENIGLLALSLFTSLFWRPLSVPLVNADWAQGRHEWEYGLTLAPIFIIYYLYRDTQWRSLRWRSPGFARIAAGLTIAVLVLTPLALNFYAPAWNEFLKQLPYIRSTSSLLRFFCLYVPVIVVCIGIAVDRASQSDAPLRRKIVLVAIAVIVAQSAITDRRSYAGESYNPSAITGEYARAAEAGIIRPIDRIADGGAFPDPGDAMASGGSAIPCYQPMFGYRMEKFPLGALQPGPIMSERAGVLNLKNPACYLFPKENKCAPGDHFTIAQTKEAEDLASYKPFPFKQPASQVIATKISIASSMACIMGLMLGGFLWRRRRGSPEALR